MRARVVITESHWQKWKNWTIQRTLARLTPSTTSKPAWRRVSQNKWAVGFLGIIPLVFLNVDHLTNTGFCPKNFPISSRSSNLSQFQEIWDILPRNQRGRRRKLNEANRMQKTLQIPEVRGDWRKATNLIPIWTLHPLLLGCLQWNHCVDRGASLPLDFPGGRIRWNPRSFSGLFLYDCLGWPQGVHIHFMVQMPWVKVMQLFRTKYWQ